MKSAVFLISSVNVNVVVMPLCIVVIGSFHRAVPLFFKSDPRSKARWPMLEACVNGLSPLKNLSKPLINSSDDLSNTGCLPLRIACANC